MANHAQDTLLAHLTSPDSLDYLLMEGFSREDAREVLPTEIVKKVTAWSLNYFFENQRTVAPSKEAILEAWGEGLEAAELVINDEVENDSVQGAVKQLRANYAEWRSQELVRAIAQSVSSADPDQKVAMINEAAYDFYDLANVLRSRKRHLKAPELYEDAVERYIDRRDNGKVTRGMTFGMGMELLDKHFHGLHPGELMTFAGATGSGKSFFAARCVLSEWRAGRKAIYFTLENDTPMTADRLICMHAGVSYSRWQEGRADDAELDRIELAADAVAKSDNPFEVIMPGMGERKVLDMYRQALVLGADTIIIDQLTFIEHTSKSRDEHIKITDTMHELKGLINEGSEQLSCLLIHQVNREGVEHARKNGRYEPIHMKGGSEIENTSDLLITIYQTPDQYVVGEAYFHTLKFRRGVRKDWEMAWRIDAGDIRVRKELVDA